MMHDRVEGMLTMSSGYQLHWEPNGVGGRTNQADRTSLSRMINGDENNGREQRKGFAG